LRWAVSRAFIFSHSPPSLSFCSRPTRAPHSGAQINALRAQPDAQPDANAPDTKVRHHDPTRAMPPSSLVLRKRSAILLLLRLLLRFAPPRWVSSDLF